MLCRLDRRQSRLASLAQLRRGSWLSLLSAYHRAHRTTTRLQSLASTRVVNVRDPNLHPKFPSTCRVMTVTSDRTLLMTGGTGGIVGICPLTKAGIAGCS